ncbi:MAG TPA: O-antigen ligase family protein [Candidatus Baltobacteraceae bacterium]|nr:O-antigen ligase family protein [Candidatus Baltobacteraceae bacterium]
MIPDPLSLLAFAVFFTGAALATMRRPVYGVCVLAACTPFALYQLAGSTTVTLLKAGIAAVAVGLFVRPHALAPLRDSRARPMLLGGAAVIAATAITYAHAAYPGAVVRETLKAVEYVIAFCLVYCAYRIDPDSAAVRRTLIGVTVVVCALALTQEFYGATSVLLMNGHPTPRIAGPLEGPNQLAGYFDVTLPLLLAFAVAAQGEALTAAIFLCALTDVLTFSRGGAIGAAAAIAALAYVYRGALLRVVKPLAAGAIAGAMGAVAWGGIAHTFGLSRFWDLSPSAYGGGVGTRPLLWRAAWHLWREHPVFGVGAGNFEREIGQTGVTRVRTHANSLYLQSLVEGGIALFAATIFLIVSALRTLARSAARSPLTAGAFAATLALAAHQVVDLLVFYPKVGAWWWIVLALGAAAE